MHVYTQSYELVSLVGLQSAQTHNFFLSFYHFGCSRLQVVYCLGNFFPAHLNLRVVSIITDPLHDSSRVVCLPHCNMHKFLCQLMQYQHYAC